MSNTTAAIRAAKEVQADTLAPELYRQAREWYQKSLRDYRLKNFKEAELYAKKARSFAEWAEFEALRNGAARAATTVDPLGDNTDQAADLPLSRMPQPPARERSVEAPQDPSAQGTYYESMETQGQGSPPGAGAPPSGGVPNEDPGAVPQSGASPE